MPAGAVIRPLVSRLAWHRRELARTSAARQSYLVQRTSGISTAACATPGEANESLGRYSQNAEWPAARTSPRLRFGIPVDLDCVSQEYSDRAPQLMTGRQIAK